MGLIYTTSTRRDNTNEALGSASDTVNSSSFLTEVVLTNATSAINLSMDQKINLRSSCYKLLNQAKKQQLAGYTYLIPYKTNQTPLTTLIERCAKTDSNTWLSSLKFPVNTERRVVNENDTTGDDPYHFIYETYTQSNRTDFVEACMDSATYSINSGRSPVNLDDFDLSKAEQQIEIGQDKEVSYLYYLEGMPANIRYEGQDFKKQAFSYLSNLNSYYIANFNILTSALDTLPEPSQLKLYQAKKGNLFKGSKSISLIVGMNMDEGLDNIKNIYKEFTLTYWLNKSIVNSYYAPNYESSTITALYDVNKNSMWFGEEDDCPDYIKEQEEADEDDYFKWETSLQSFNYSDFSDVALNFSYSCSAYVHKKTTEYDAHGNLISTTEQNILQGSKTWQVTLTTDNPTYLGINFSSYISVGEFLKVTPPIGIPVVTLTSSYREGNLYSDWTPTAQKYGTKLLKALGMTRKKDIQNFFSTLTKDSIYSKNTYTLGILSQKTVQESYICDMLTYLGVNIDQPSNVGRAYWFNFWKWLGETIYKDIYTPNALQNLTWSAVNSLPTSVRTNWIGFVLKNVSGVDYYLELTCNHIYYLEVDLSSYINPQSAFYMLANYIYKYAQDGSSSLLKEEYDFASLPSGYYINVLPFCALRDIGYTLPVFYKRNKIDNREKAGIVALFNKQGNKVKVVIVNSPIWRIYTNMLSTPRVYSTTDYCITFKETTTTRSEDDPNFSAKDISYASPTYSNSFIRYGGMYAETLNFPWSVVSEPSPLAVPILSPVIARMPLIYVNELPSAGLSSLAYTGWTTTTRVLSILVSTILTLLMLAGCVYALASIQTISLLDLLGVIALQNSQSLFTKIFGKELGLYLYIGLSIFFQFTASSGANTLATLTPASSTGVDMTEAAQVKNKEAKNNLDDLDVIGRQNASLVSKIDLSAFGHTKLETPNEYQQRTLLTADQIQQAQQNVVYSLSDCTIITPVDEEINYVG